MSPEATLGDDSHPTDRAAVLRGLRRAGDEAQFTQVIGSFAGEPGFASAFVRTLLSAAKARHAEKVEQLEPIPESLTCIAEMGVKDRNERLGRPDLRFDDSSGFTLFVENKLYSGYGERQVERYLRALSALPPDRERTGLIAVTRDIPGYGEPPADTPGWLGSVRWATVLPELRELPLAEPLRSEWRLLLEIMYEEGDLGTTQPNIEAIQAWALHGTGREELAKLLKEIRDEMLGVLRDAMGERYPERKPSMLVDHHTFGRRGRVPVKHELTRTRIGYRIPASEQAEPGLTIHQQLLSHTSLHGAGRASRSRGTRCLRGFDAGGGVATVDVDSWIFHERGTWGRVHDEQEWLRNDDVAAALARLAAADIMAIVGSGLFDLDVSGDQPAKRGIRRWRRRGEIEEES